MIKDYIKKRVNVNYATRVAAMTRHGNTEGLRKGWESPGPRDNVLVVTDSELQNIQRFANAFECKLCGNFLVHTASFVCCRLVMGREF